MPTVKSEDESFCSFELVASMMEALQTTGYSTAVLESCKVSGKNGIPTPSPSFAKWSA